MTLSEYMTTNGYTDEAFARDLGVAHRLTVNRYRRGKRIPRPEIMARITEITRGAVTANDFFGLPGALPPLESTGAAA